MKKYLQNLLAWLSRRILAKHKPKIIGITGSVGKTSAKEAIFSVVSQKFFAWRSRKNFNSEFGLPYAIMGIKNDPGRSVGAWLGLLGKGFILAFLNRKYPEILVLEMGVDHPGDMDYLLSIAHPNIAVITNISFAHHEFFKDIESIANEKGKLAEVMGPDEFLVVNADNPKAFEQKNKSRAKVISYSAGGDADVAVRQTQYNFSEKPSSLLKVTTKDWEGEVNIKAIGNTHLSAIAAACAVGEVLQIEKDLVIKGLESYKPSPGRLNIVAGIKHSIIIDDSYNASPDSMKEALELLSLWPKDLKIAILGDMLELGEVFHEQHLEIGKQAGALSVAHLITVGAGGKLIAEGARTVGLAADKILSFNTADEAKKVIKGLLGPEAVVLVKGSQGMRMEKVTAELLAEPMRAHELLVRQYGKWLEK